MTFVRTDLILLGGSKPDLNQALARLSEAHDVLRYHAGSFPAEEGDNPLELTRKAMAVLQEIMRHPTS